MAQQKASGNYSNPYLFNGKELDEETGLYYYGARYYNPRYSLWLGVDPMVEKYSGVSPYNFTMNNPIILVDFDGADWDPSNLSDTKAYGLFIGTRVGRIIRDSYTHGKMKNHLFKISIDDIGVFSGLTSISIGTNDEKPVPIGSVKASDIKANSRIFINVRVDGSETIDDALTIGHEIFLHVEKQAELINKILIDPNLSAGDKAKNIRRVYEEGFISDPNSGKRLPGPGDSDHARILNKSNRSYEAFKSELYKILDSKGKSELDASIEASYNQYFKDPWIRWKAKVGEYENE